jgi:hypothetical protein
MRWTGGPLKPAVGLSRAVFYDWVEQAFRPALMADMDGGL